MLKNVKFDEKCYLSNVALGTEPDHDIQLLQLDINWVIVLDKEGLDLML